MNNDAMWAAFVRCDHEYDGMYYVAVKTTGIYCRPSCSVRKPLRKNVEFVAAREEAEQNGYRPCKRCRPDLIVYRPLAEMAEAYKTAIERHYRDKERLADETRKLCVSKNHIARLFHEQYDMTPHAYRNRLCVEYAMRQLAQTDESVLKIAYASGFESLSAFYSSFSKWAGATPGQYRIRAKKEGDA